MELATRKLATILKVMPSMGISLVPVVQGEAKTV
jgi:hypothetical protein